MADTSTVSGTISLDLLFKEVIQSGGFKQGPLTNQFRLGPIRLPNGSSVGNINKVCSIRESGIGAGVATSYDLTALLDAIGDAIGLEELVLVAVRQLSADDADFLLVGPNVVNPAAVLGGITAGKGFFADASDRVVLQSQVAESSGGSWLVLHADEGVPVDATHKVLDVITAAGSAGNSWDILIAGRSTS